MSAPEYRHFKLANGEEIICEVVEWDTEDNSNIIVRKSMKLVPVSDEEDIRYYSFRPWMLTQFKFEDVQMVNSIHIVGEADPSNIMIDQYKMICDELASAYEMDTADDLMDNIDNLALDFDSAEAQLITVH